MGSESATGRIAARAAATAAALLLLALALPVAGLHAQEPAEERVIIGSITVEGNQRLRDSVVRTESGLRVGDAVGYREINRAIRRLWSTGQFSDIRVSVAEDETDPDGGVTVILQVEERPYIAGIQFSGLQNVSMTAVRDSAGLRMDAPLNPSQVVEARNVIRRLLADKGYQVRSIKDRLEPIEDRPGEYVLLFEVEEGQRVAIAEIVFEGNRAFSDSQLRKVLDLKPEGFLWFRRGTYDEQKLRADLRENLPAFYGSHGYIDFAVTADSLVVDPETGKARLVVHVDEGPQYRLADFNVRGNRRFDAEDLARFFERPTGGLLNRVGLGGSEERERGEVFDHSAFMEATQRVQQLYSNNGYLGAVVQPVIERTTSENGDAVVRLSWEIREGEPAYVNRVLIRGNTFTHEEVIRDRIFLLPGDVYSEDLLIRSYQQIMGLGFFETPLPMPQIEQTPDGDVDIIFEVQEKQTGSVNFGTSIGGWGGLSGFLGYEQPNLFGRAKSGHLRWEYGRFSNNFDAGYSDPSILGTRTSGSISLFNSRDRFSPLTDEGQRRRTGAGIRFGVPFPLDRRFSRVFMGYTLARTSYEQLDGVESAIFGLPPGVQSTVSLGLARQTLNSPLFPTNGSRQEIEASFSGGILGGDGRFQKYTASGDWWVPVGQLGGKSPGSRPIQFALGLSAEVGTLFGDASRFPFERFLLGGVQYGRPLRGYDESTITPSGYFPRHTEGISAVDRFGNAYMRMSAEYAMRFNDNISLSLFYDAGNVWNRVSEIDPTRLYRGAGVGVMLMTPFGPLGLDYAYGFDKDDPGWQLHFKFGQGF